MVLILQIALLMSVAFFRWRQFLGSGLKPSASKKFPNALEYISKSKDQTYSRWIGLRQEARFPFVVRRERWYHRFLKFIGVAHEISVQDDTINRKLYFITDYPSHLEESLKSDSMQAALKRLFDLPVKGLFVSTHKTWCVMRGSAHDMDADYYDQIRTLMTRIPEALKDGAESSVQRLGVNTGYWAFLALALHMGLLLTAMFGALPTLLDHMEIVSHVEWYATAVFFGLMLSGIWLAVLLWFFQGTSWAGWVLVDFLVAGLFGIMITSGYALREANILLDTAAPVVHVKPVVDRSCSLTCSKSEGYGKRRRTRSTTHTLAEAMCEAGARQATINQYLRIDYKCHHSASFSYHLAMEAWRAGSTKPYRFSTSSKLFDAVRRGTLMHIPSHPGRFGIEWVDIDSIQPAQ
jgi:hypothetical protein